MGGNPFCQALICNIDTIIRCIPVNAVLGGKAALKSVCQRFRTGGLLVNRVHRPPLRGRKNYCCRWCWQQYSSPRVSSPGGDGGIRSAPLLPLATVSLLPPTASHRSRVSLESRYGRSGPGGPPPPPFSPPHSNQSLKFVETRPRILNREVKSKKKPNLKKITIFGLNHKTKTRQEVARRASVLRRLAARRGWALWIGRRWTGCGSWCRRW